MLPEAGTCAPGHQGAAPHASAPSWCALPRGQAPRLTGELRYPTSLTKHKLRNKIIKNFKMVTPEHTTKCRTLLRAGPYVTVQVTHLWKQSCVVAIDLLTYSSGPREVSKRTPVAACKVSFGPLWWHWDDCPSLAQDNVNLIISSFDRWNIWIYTQQQSIPALFSCQRR